MNGVPSRNDFAPFAANFGSGPVFPDAMAPPPAPLWSPLVLAPSEELGEESSLDEADTAAVPASKELLPSAQSKARAARDASALREEAAHRQDETLEDLLNRLRRAPEWFRHQWPIPWLR